MFSRLVLHFLFALALVLQIQRINAGQKQAKDRFVEKRHSSRSSSESSDNCPSCFKQIKRCLCENKRALDEIAAKIDFLVANGCIPIKAIPSGGLVINKPGCYVVVNDLTYMGTTNPAITITCDNVILKGEPDFTLTISPLSTGIVANGIKNLTIENLSVVASEPSLEFLNIGFFFTDVDNFVLQRVRTSTLFRGCNLIGCRNGKFIECVQEDHGNGFNFDEFTNSRAIRGDTLTNISFDRCEYRNNCWVSTNNEPGFSSDAIIIFGPAENIRFSNCIGFNSNIALEANGVLVENCTFNFDIPFPLAQFEAFDAGVHGAVIRNCIFRNLNANPITDGIGFYSGSSLLVENCTFELNATGYNPGTTIPELFSSMITLGDAVDQSPINNAIIRNCSMNGGSPDPESQRAHHAIYVGPGSNGILIEDVSISHLNSGALPFVPNSPDYRIYTSPVLGGAICVDGANGVVIRGVAMTDIASGTLEGQGPGDGIFLAGSYALTMAPFYTTTSASFVQPGVNGNVSITVGDTSSITQGQTVSVDGGGLYTVFSINSPMSMTITNTGAVGNASPGTTISAGANISLGELIPATSNCTIEGCIVTACTGTGIRNDAPNGANLVVNNYSYNNGTNFAGVPGLSLVNQGDPSRAGENMKP